MTRVRARRRGTASRPITRWKTSVADELIEIEIGDESEIEFELTW